MIGLWLRYQLARVRFQMACEWATLTGHGHDAPQYVLDALHATTAAEAALRNRRQQP